MLFFWPDQVTGFLDKNKDRLYDDLEACVCSSSSPYLRGLFADHGSSSNAKKESQGGRFKRQLTALMASLAATEPQYIRSVAQRRSRYPMQIEGGGGV